MWKRLCKPDKELMTNKERQDIELCAQKATLQQQRSHIEILESALNRAQMHINQVEEQVIEHQFKLIPSQSDSFFLGGGRCNVTVSAAVRGEGVSSGRGIITVFIQQQCAERGIGGAKFSERNGQHGDQVRMIWMNLIRASQLRRMVALESPVSSAWRGNFQRLINGYFDQAAHFFF